MKYRLNDFPVYGVTSDFPLASIGFLPIITLQCMLPVVETFLSYFFFLVYVEQGRVTTATTLTFTTASTSGITWEAKVCKSQLFFQFE